MKWHCHVCGWEGTAPDEVKVLFHPCSPPKGYQRSWTPPALEGTTLAEVWAAIFASSYGGMRAPTIEEALKETGEFGRRKEGSGRDE